MNISKLDSDDHASGFDLGELAPSFNDALRKWKWRSKSKEEEAKIIVRQIPIWLWAASEALGKQYKVTQTQVLACALHYGLEELQSATGIKTRRRRYEKLMQTASVNEIQRYKQTPFYQWSCGESTVTDKPRQIPVANWEVGLLSELCDALHCSQNTLIQTAIVLGIADADEGSFRDDFFEIAQVEAQSFKEWLTDL